MDALPLAGDHRLRGIKFGLSDSKRQYEPEGLVVVVVKR